MIRMNNTIYVLFLVLAMVFSTRFNLNAQAMPEILTEGTLEEQYDYLTERTNIYNNFRAIREDMFLTIRRNSIDSLDMAYNEINALNQSMRDKQATIDSLNLALDEVSAERDIAIRDRDSLSFLGLPIKKSLYNAILWSVIVALAVLLVVLYLMFKNAKYVTRKTTLEMNELRTEYDEYRKNSRERFEQQSIDHFNEIKRLKGL